MTDYSLKNFIFLHSIKMVIMCGKTILMKILHKDNQKETVFNLERDKHHVFL